MIKLSKAFMSLMLSCLFVLCCFGFSNQVGANNRDKELYDALVVKPVQGVANVIGDIIGREMKIKYYDEEIRGVENLVIPKDENSSITAETYEGEKLRFSYYNKLRTLSDINNQKAQQKLDPITYLKRDRKYVIRLIAKKGNKVVKDFKVTHVNKDDNYIEYYVEKGVTDIEIKFWGHDYLVKGERGSSEGTMEDKDFFSIFIKVKEKPLFGGLFSGKNNDGKTSPQNNSSNVNAGGEANQDSSEDDGMGMGTIAGGVAAAGGALWLGGKLLGDGEAAAGGAGSAGPRVPNNPYYKKDGEDLIYTDPVTGAQSLYTPDDDGNWVNAETGGVLDLDRVDEFTKQREDDRDWIQTQRDKTQKRDTLMDRELKKQYDDYRNDLAKIDEETKRDLYAVQTGQYGLSQEERDARWERKKDEHEQEFNKQMNRADTYDTLTKGAEGVQAVADIGVDVLGTITAPAGGGLIADGYSLFKNSASYGAEARANGGSVFGGIVQGAVNGAIDVAQNHAGGKWGKFAADVGGEMFRGGMNAAIKGESMVNGTLGGLAKGSAKQAINGISEKMGAKLDKTNTDKFRNSLNNARNNVNSNVPPKVKDSITQMAAHKYTTQQTIDKAATAAFDSATRANYNYTIDNASDINKALSE